MAHGLAMIMKSGAKSQAGMLEGREQVMTTAHDRPKGSRRGLLALRAAGVGFQLVQGLRRPAWEFADDLIRLICHSAEGMSRLIQVVADFCNWSRMRIKICKVNSTIITSQDYGT